MINGENASTVDVSNYKYYRNTSGVLLLGALVTLFTVGSNESGDIKNPLYLDSPLMMFAIMFGLTMTAAGAQCQKFFIEKAAEQKNTSTSRIKEVDAFFIFTCFGTLTLLSASLYAVCAVTDTEGLLSAPAGNDGPQSTGEIAAFSALYGTLFLMAIAAIAMSFSYFRQLQRITAGTEVYITSNSGPKESMWTILKNKIFASTPPITQEGKVTEDQSQKKQPGSVSPGK